MSFESGKAEQARRRLYPFVEQAWPIIEPASKFVGNWHIGMICELLEAVTLGQIQNLLINIPPGCMKSILVSIMWPVWEWGPKARPELRYLCGSYDEGLSIEHARKSRDIIESEWYVKYFRKEWALRADQNAKTHYDNTKTGWRIATSVGGKGTGKHPHRKIIDDPHNVKKSLSDVQREDAIKWFALTMGSRGAALLAATIVIMQRLHEQDLSGHILEKLPDVFTHVCLPMRYEPPAMVQMSDGSQQLQPRMKPTPLGQVDPRTEKGALLWPKFQTADVVKATEASLSSTMGEYGVAGQMQQRPAPEAGGIFKREFVQILDAMPADAFIIARGRGWDMGATENAGDPTAGVRIALLHDGRIIVEDVVREQTSDSDALMRSTADADAAECGPGVVQAEEQEPGSAGKKVISSNTIRMAGHDYRGTPSTADKVTRARPFASQWKSKNVFLLRRPWNKAYIDELAAFPNGTHDDQVDGTSKIYNEIALDTTSVTIGRTSGH